MDQVSNLRSRTSWLSLVAETAGVSGATITRVDVTCPEARCVTTVYVQVLDSVGRVVGATRHAAPAAELRDGLTLDLGYDLELSSGAHIVAWAEPGVPAQRAFSAQHPDDVTYIPFEPFSNMKFMLSLENPLSGPLAA